MITINENILLIADPFLKDKNFIRSVIYLCSHHAEGSLGFTLNKKTNLKLNQIIPGLDSCTVPVYAGGPVGLDTIHFLHQLPELIPDSQQVAANIYWGGDFETLKDLMRKDLINLKKIKFFIGYSGWSPGQLENEIEEKTWLSSGSNYSIIFNTPDDEIWKQSIKLLGPKFEPLINYPIDPQLN